MHKQVWICIEKAEGNYGAYAPAVLGCIATGKTIEETRNNMIDALAFHFEGMADDGESLDSISGDFPVKEAHKAEEEYYALVDVEVADLGVGV